MNPKSPSLLFLFFLLFHSATAFNVTKMLEQYPNFSNFNNYLTQAQLADEINSRRTITILAVDNSGISPLSGQSTDMLKKIMSLHVVLDYYDVPKLQKLPNKTDILTTLFQASGQATGQQGFLNVTDLSTGSVAIGSAVSGSSLGATLVKAVVAQPYNVSVLQITTIIMPTGISNSKSNSSSSLPPAATPTKSPTPAASPAKSPPTEAPEPSVATTPSAAPPKSSGEAPAVAPADDSSASTPSDAPSDANSPSDATAPSDADAPTSSADAPLGSPPSPSVASGPAADGAAAPEGESSGTRATLGTQLAVLMMVVSSTWCFASMI